MKYQKEANALWVAVESAALRAGDSTPRDLTFALRSAVQAYEKAAQAAAMADAEDAKLEMRKAKTFYEEGIQAVRAATAQVVAQYIKQVAELEVQIELLKQK